MNKVFIADHLLIDVSKYRYGVNYSPSASLFSFSFFWNFSFCCVCGGVRAWVMRAGKGKCEKYDDDGRRV